MQGHVSPRALVQLGYEHYVSSATYFAVRKTTQHKLPQLKLGPTIYAIRPPVDEHLAHI